MTNLEKIKLVLQEASPKVRDYQLKRKEKRQVGADFNIFSIMGMERSEVKAHSAMIAELLNPKGSHGQGDIFLRSFLGNIKDCNVLSKNGEGKYKLDKWKLANPSANDTVIVMKEKSYPNDKDSGKDNRIDIVIEFDNLIILIENKIDALDQHRQLERYSKVGGNSGKDYCLLYLTIEGHPASNKSSGDGDIKYDKISYREHILQWLNLCLREEKVMHRAVLQKAILQYLDTVKKITGKNMNSEYEDEMFELLSEDENLKWAEEISKFIPKVKGKMLDDFFEMIRSELEKDGILIGSIKNMPQDLIWSKGKGKQWFYGPTNKQRSKNFGLFFDIGVQGVLFYVMVASKALHYGRVNIEEHEGNLPTLVAPSKEAWENEPEELNDLKRRDWSSIKWYSRMYEYKKDSWNFLAHPNEFMILTKSKDILECMKITIKKLKNESPSGVDNQPS